MDKITCGLINFQIPLGFLFLNMIFYNFWYGRNTGRISKKYELNCTPSGETFKIWGVIYFQIGRTIITKKVKRKKLISESFNYNRLWLEAFNSDEIEKAYNYIIDLNKINQQLKDLPGFATYAAWVRIAMVLNECIIDLKKTKLDTSFKKIISFLEKQNSDKLTLIEIKIILFSLRGIIDNINIKKLNKRNKYRPQIDRILYFFEMFSKKYNIDKLPQTFLEMIYFFNN
tara:strand:- start:2216 stop:2902 length:687 start_codon:yes stop_codon:yes gene_type:complete